MRQLHRVIRGAHRLGTVAARCALAVPTLAQTARARVVGAIVAHCRTAPALLAVASIILSLATTVRSQCAYFLRLESSGAGTLLVWRGERAWIIDGGKKRVDQVVIGDQTVMEVLRANGVKTLGIVLSHPHFDHMKGALASLDAFTAAGFLHDLTLVATPESELKCGLRERLASCETATCRTRLVVLGPGESFGNGEEGDPVAVSILNLGEAGRVAVHDRTLVTEYSLKGTAGSTKCVEFSDASPRLVQRYTELKRPCDFFSVPHHGAREQYMDGLVNKQLFRKGCIIHVNRANQYGHPATVTLASLKKAFGDDAVLFTASELRLDADIALEPLNPPALLRAQVAREQRFIVKAMETCKLWASASSFDFEKSRAAEAAVAARTLGDIIVTQLLSDRVDVGPAMKRVVFEQVATALGSDWLRETAAAKIQAGLDSHKISAEKGEWLQGIISHACDSSEASCRCREAGPMGLPSVRMLLPMDEDAYRAMLEHIGVLDGLHGSQEEMIRAIEPLPMIP